MMKVKSYLHLILVILVCAFVLTACGADKTDPDSQPVADTDASEEFDDADDTDDEQDDSPEEEDDEKATVRHEIDGSVFFTVHDVEEWIKDGVFDFEKFADDFDIEGSDGTGLRFGSRDYYMALLPGKEDQLNAFGLVRGGVCNVEGIDFNPSGREVKVAGDYSVPYELLEIATYMAEFAKAQRVDFEKPVALDWLYDLDLSEDFEIMFWQ